MVVLAAVVVIIGVLLEITVVVGTGDTYVLTLVTPLGILITFMESEYELGDLDPVLTFVNCTTGFNDGETAVEAIVVGTWILCAVVVIEVVHTDHLKPVTGQTCGQRRADEPCHPGNKHLHLFPTPMVLARSVHGTLATFDRRTVDALNRTPTGHH